MSFTVSQQRRATDSPHLELIQYPCRGILLKVEYCRPRNTCRLVVLCPTSHLGSESQKRANQPSHATHEHTLEKQQQTSYPSKQSHPQETSFSVVDLTLMQANMILSEQYLPCTTLHALRYADDAATSLPQRRTPPIDAKF
jgi:hypothetical protein